MPDGPLDTRRQEGVHNSVCHSSESTAALKFIRAFSYMRVVDDCAYVESTT
jgi:hypothetical protein